jgi:hypothetical protein
MKEPVVSVYNNYEVQIMDFDEFFDDIHDFMDADNFIGDLFYDTDNDMDDIFEFEFVFHRIFTSS